MAKGGARARSGPAPTSQDRSHKAKQPDAQGWVTLPADGRPGDAPAFPLLDPAPRELDLWHRLWATPQAVMWEQLHQAFEVAAYVRLLSIAEQPDAPIVSWAQVKQVAESLGLSVAGMARNRWTIAPADAEEVVRVDTSTMSGVSSLTARLKAVADG
ncbi:phage terminase small subunit [Streptomyces mirabilis]